MDALRSRAFSGGAKPNLLISIVGEAMQGQHGVPRVLNLLDGQAIRAKQCPYGTVGTVHSGQGIEAVRVSKRGEAVDPGWFSPPVADLILVVQGQLRIEFASPEFQNRILRPGDLLVLPPQTRCRAFPWPREAEDAALLSTRKSFGTAKCCVLNSTL